MDSSQELIWKQVSIISIGDPMIKTMEFLVKQQLSHTVVGLSLGLHINFHHQADLQQLSKGKMNLQTFLEVIQFLWAIIIKVLNKTLQSILSEIAKTQEVCMFQVKMRRQRPRLELSFECRSMLQRKMPLMEAINQSSSNLAYCEREREVHLVIINHLRTMLLL